MLDVGIDKHFITSRIATKKTQDILELLQWFRKYFYDHHISENGSILPSSQRLSSKTRISIQDIKQPSVINKSSANNKRLPSPTLEK